MTGKDLVLQIKVKLNKLDTASNRVLRPEVALVFLNDVYIKLVRSKFIKNGGTTDMTAFQYNQLLTDELNFLTIPKEVDVLGGEDGSDYYVDITTLDNYWIHLRSKIKTSLNSISEWCNDPGIVSLDSLGPTLNDPFNSTSFNDPILYFEDNKIKIPHTDFSVTKYGITYLRKPEEITLAGEVFMPFADELVDEATVAILESWENPRVQSKITVDKVLNTK